MPGIKVKLTYQVLYAFSQVVFPLITFPYLAKVIGPEGLGKVALIEYVSGFVVALAALGIPFLGVREIASFQADAKKRRDVFSKLFTIHLLASIIGIAFFLFFIQFKENSPPATLLLLGCVNILLPAFIADWYFQGMEKFRFIAIRNIIVRAVGLVAILLIIKNSEHFILYYAIVIVSQVIIALTSVWRIRLSFPNLHPGSAFRNYGKSLLPFFLTTSFISLYVFLDVIILGWVADDQQVGYYSTALKIVKLTLFIALSLVAVLFPRLSALVASGQMDESLTLINKSLQFIVVVTVPLCTVLYILAPEIIVIVLGNKFASSLPLLRILSILPLIIGLSNVFAFQILLPFHRERALLKAVIITTVFCLLINPVLANIYAAEGTSIATLCTELCAVLTMGGLAIKIIRYRFPFLQLFQSLLAVLPMVGVVLLCRHFLADDIITIISCGLGLVLYAIIQFAVFKSTMSQDLLQHIKSAWIK